MEPADVAIIGSGNIGTDLMEKIARSEHIRVAAMVGIDPDSVGLARARARGAWATSGGLADLLTNGPPVAFAFDATSADSHREHARMLADAGVRCIDLTPAALAPPVIPAVNMDDALGEQEVNLVTCGAQATVPIVAAISQVCEVPYAETVSTIASLSAGPGTRANIDEFTIATARAHEQVGGAARGKAIIILNPAVPPLVMRNTVHLQVAEHDPAKLAEAVETMVATVAQYVPGYRLVREPLDDGTSVTVFLEVRGAGDFLPDYAGNLDIMTAAGVRVAESLARKAA